MGNFSDICFREKPESSLTQGLNDTVSSEKFKNENPHLSKDFKKLPFSRKNDSYFLYISDINVIDLTLAKIENAEKLKESDLETLDNTLNQLEELRKKYNIFDTPKEGANSHSGDFEMDMGDKSFETPKKLLEKGKTNISYSSSLAVLNKEIKDCTFTSEIQASEICNLGFVKSNELAKYFIKIRLFHAEPGQNTPEKIKNSEVIESFSTSRKEETLSIWETIFQYRFDSKDAIPRYYVGISFNFDQKNNSTHFELGEQYFSLSSLLDQKLQSKELEFRIPSQKGPVSKILIRFQLVHDPSDIKERLFREVSTRIERAKKLKSKGRTFSTGLMMSPGSVATSFFNDSKSGIGSYYEAGSIESSFVMK